MIKTHLDAFNIIINKLNENKINFVIIRGFKFLPRKPDTDLDIIINPNDYNNFLNLINELLKEEIIIKGREKIYYYNKNEYVYLPFFTHTRLTDGNHIHGNKYRFDTYSDLFFFESEKEAFVVNTLLKRFLFENKKKVNNYYIPDPISEIMLLIFRNVFDKNGKWGRKHKNRIFDLLKDIDIEQFNYIKSFFYKDDILNLLNNKNFELINKPDIELNIFIIRKFGLKNDIIDFILNKIQECGYKIFDIINIGFNDNKKVFKKFYQNFDIHENDILNINGNECICIVTDFKEGKFNPKLLKLLIRKKYIKYAPPIGNIIHSSDSPEDCKRELNILLDENAKNFKNVGTYYSHKKNNNY